MWTTTLKVLYEIKAEDEPTKITWLIEEIKKIRLTMVLYTIWATFT